MTCYSCGNTGEMFDPYTGEHCGVCGCNLVNPEPDAKDTIPETPDLITAAAWLRFVASVPF